MGLMIQIFHTSAVLAIAFILDLIFGDPAWLYHPVRLIGMLINACEKLFRRIMPKSARGERTAGLFTVIVVLLCCFIVPFAIIRVAHMINFWLAFAVECFMCYQMLAVKSLKVESMYVYDALKNEGLEAGQKMVARIVGRDTAVLDEIGVTKAAVETVAENFSDGIIAPMLYTIIGGPVLMFVYKGINTMDSMIAYKNSKYINFGRYAAKLDDIANFIPARLAGLLLLFAGLFLGMDVKNGWKIFKRDRYNHASPNSAQTESCAAGLLQIQLAGDAYYFGELYKKKTIGDPIRSVEIEDIVRMNRLLYMGSFLAVVLFGLIRILGGWIII